MENLSNPNAITILKCKPRHRTSKIHERRRSNGAIKTTPFDAGTWFNPSEVQVRNIHELHGYLTLMEDRSDLLIIRGALNPEYQRDPDELVRRLKHPRPEEGVPIAPFIEVPRNWVQLDFDGIPNPGGLDPTSREAMEYLRTLLPPEFQDVACSFSLSSSAGMNTSSAIRGHLWFYLDRPVGQSELEVWLAEAPVDNHLFLTVHPHYVAAPLFKERLEDPVKQRKGMLEGRHDEVKVPDIDVRSYVARSSAGGTAGLKTARGYEARLARLGDGPDGDGCHGVITPAIAAYLKEHGPGADREALKADIRARVAEAFWDRSKHSEHYVAREISDAALDSSIDDWIKKAFIVEEPYSATRRYPTEEARAMIARAIGNWITDADRWLSGRKYRKALSEDRVGVELGEDGRPRLIYYDEPRPTPFKSSKTSVRAMFPPPRHALKAQVSLGKTGTVIDRLPDLVDKLARGHCVLLTVPNHKLSSELMARIRALGLQVEVYLGPAQPDPKDPEQKMCRRAGDYEVFQAAGMGPQLCAACQYKADCAYLKQRQMKSQIWIAAHNIIFYSRRPPIPPVDYLIIDEDPVGAGYEGHSGDDADDDDRRREYKVAELSPDVARSLKGIPLAEPFSRDEIDVSDRRLHELMRREYLSLVHVELPENATDENIEEVREILLLNLAAIAQAQLYDTIRRFGPFGMRLFDDPEDGLKLFWNRQRRLHNDFDVPMLILDATLDGEVIRHLVDAEQAPVGWKAEAFIDEGGSIAYDNEYPMMPIVGPVWEIQTDTPAVTIRQVLFSGAASKFKAKDTGSGNIGRVRRYIEARSAFGGKVLVICQKELEADLNDLGLPENVQTAHFNAIRGKDEWRDVDVVIVIGRTQPPTGVVEARAEALFRANVGVLGAEYYETAWKPLSGEGRLVRRERHPDPLAELVRWGSCEAEVIQAIGRGRPVNRTAENPLQVDLINLLPLPDIDVDEVLEWEDAQPSPVAVVAGRYGLLLPQEKVRGVAGILARLLPDLYSSESAARQSPMYSRAETPNRKFLIGVSAREYTFAGLSNALVFLRSKDGHYSVPALRVDLLAPESNPLTSSAFNADALGKAGVTVSSTPPRKWREKLKSDEDIRRLFGLPSL